MKKEQKPRKRAWLYGIVILLLLLPSLWKIYQVNAAFPPTEEVYVECGEEYPMGEDLLIQVQSMELLDRQQLEERYGEYISWEEGHDERGVIVKAMIRNSCEEDRKFEMYRFYLETDTYFNNGMDRDMYLLENQDAFVLTLEGGEEREVFLAYSMWDSHFSEKNWENMDEITFYLVNERYPKKVYWKIK